MPEVYITIDRHLKENMREARSMEELLTPLVHQQEVRGHSLQQASAAPGDPSLLFDDGT